MRILWLKTGPLHPLNTGGRIRTFQMLRELRKRHEITYLSLLPEGTPETVTAAATEYATRCRWVPWAEIPRRHPQFYLDVLRNAFFSSLPYVIEKYAINALAQAVAKETSNGRHDLLVCDFLAPAENILRMSGRSTIPSVLFEHNVETRIWERLAGTAGVMLRGYFRNQARRMRRYEKLAATTFDGVISVSPEDSRIFRDEFGLTNVTGAVPTGVDVAHFQHPASSKRQPGEIVFLGSMDWMPNVDAVLWYAREIHPRVRAAMPEAKLTVVGRNPPASLQALAAATPGMQVTGTVDDVRPYLHRAMVNVVPLRVGGGTRIKIFEAMASGAAVISTSIGAEGLPVTNGQDILLADTPETFSQAVLTLLHDPKQREKIAENGRTRVAAAFSWENAVAEFERLCSLITKNSGE